MDVTGVPSPKINWDAPDLPGEWKKFKQHVELMFSGPLRSKSQVEKCSYLLLWAGEKGRDIYNSWTLTEEAAKLLKTYYDEFEKYVLPKKNTIFARYKFNEKVQGTNESLEQFITELKLLVKDCAYANDVEMVRDRIVFGVQSAKVREKLLNEGSELTLQKATDIARSHEFAQAQTRAIEANVSNMTIARDPVVHSVQRQQQAATRRRPRLEETERDRPSERSRDYGRNCGYCGGKAHRDIEQCPARGKQCARCGKTNHFARVCKSTTRGKTVHAVNDDDDEGESEELYVDAVTKSGHPRESEQAFADIHIGEKRTVLKFKLDTGAQVNVIPLNVFDQLKSECRLRLQPTMRTLTGYGGQVLAVKGLCKIRSAYKKNSMMLDFYVVDTRAPPVLGLNACLDLDLIKLVLSIGTPLDQKAIREEFADVFKGIGLFPGECTIHVDPAATPVVCPPRRVPLALRSRLEEELQHMEDTGIIAKVTEPTEWVNALVVVEKPRTGRLRVCLDPRDLNKAIKRPHYPLPTLEDITPKLGGAKYFSVLDARSGYWAIKLSTESSKLTTFNTPFGRYRFLRLPFGLISAQDEFQRKIDETYQGLEGVVAIVDDVLVYGATKEDHDRNLRAMLQRSREKGVRLNPEKAIIGATEVSYFGHCLSAEGIKPDPEKITAIKMMKPPRNRAELETVLGMVNYLAKFAPGLSETNAPMRQLLKQSSEFLWDAQHDAAFQNMKDIITREPGPVLAYFDTKKELTIQVDASKYGLGAVLLQDGRPLSYASKSLTDTEVNYAQIEKEMYAILFGLKRFHQYAYGRHVTVESDHKPLESIMKKPLAAAPPRLQRMILQLQKYSFTIIHRPGKDIPVADTLSRKSLTSDDNSLSEGMDAQVHTVCSSLPVSDNRLKEIQVETEKDEQLTLLERVIQEGWPDEIQSCPQSVREFWNHRDELSKMNGILFKGEKIIIPGSLRDRMLEKIHTGHLGMEKCKQRARDVMFWPGMSKAIEAIVKDCEICRERQAANQKEPMLSHKIPDRPWQNVATDIFVWNGENYLVTVDYYSRFFELDRLTTTTSAAVIHKLKAAFARHGIPEILISDNGPQYSSKEFEFFAHSWEFQHLTSSPHYPQSNGLAERTVQTAKALMEKAKAAQRDPYLSILEYRNTPVDNFKSPSQLLMSRRLRSVLPNTNRQLLPEVVDYGEGKEKRQQRQRHQKRYYDRSSKPLSQLRSGEHIRVQEQGRWKPAVVIQQADTARSYLLRTAGGEVYRRNRRHLRTLSDTAQASESSTPDTPRATEEEPSPYSPDADTQTPEPLTRPMSYHTKSGREVKTRSVMDL